MSSQSCWHCCFLNGLWSSLCQVHSFCCIGVKQHISTAVIPHLIPFFTSCSQIQTLSHLLIIRFETEWVKLPLQWKCVNICNSFYFHVTKHAPIFNIMNNSRSRGDRESLALQGMSARDACSRDSHGMAPNDCRDGYC